VQLLAIPGRTAPGLFNRVIAAITKWMAAQNPPQGHKKTADNTMVFYGINGILGTGWGKSASGGKQRRNQELVSPDQGKKKISAASLQKIFHYFTFSCISSSRSKHYSWGAA